MIEMWGEHATPIRYVNVTRATNYTPDSGCQKVVLDPKSEREVHKSANIVAHAWVNLPQLR